MKSRAEKFRIPMEYCICRPLKGMTKNYWIGLYTAPTDIRVLATITPSRTLKHKKELKDILDNLIGQFRVERKP